MNKEIIDLRDYSDGDGNRISVGRNSTLRSGVIVFKEINSTVEIGENVHLNSCRIELGRNSRLVFGDNSKFNGSITVGWHSEVIIGKSLSVTRNLYIRAVESTSVVIGDDCLIASDVVIRTADGHPIYDARTRERLNTSKSIFIGDHVWLADQALVLKGARVGNACVVGARSVVTKELPANCACVGNPARVVREGITWEHSPKIVTERFYLPNAVTDDDMLASSGNDPLSDIEASEASTSVVGK